MSKPPIYPKGCDADLPADTTFGGDFHYQWSVPCAPGWPHMLGMLTIIGDAVRGVPWGSAVASPVLPKVGSVWIHTDGWIAEVIEIERDDEQGPVEYHVHLFEGEAWRLDRFLHCFRPATVIPTPTADGWRRLADEQPEDGQMCWWIPEGRDADSVMAAWFREQTAGWWLWQPVPPGVIPPPPANRDGGQ